MRRDSTAFGSDSTGSGSNFERPHKVFNGFVVLEWFWEVIGGQSGGVQKNVITHVQNWNQKLLNPGISSGLVLPPPKSGVKSLKTEVPLFSKKTYTYASIYLHFSVETRNIK